MKTLVYVEHDGGQIKDATLAAVTAASKLGEVHALVAGSNVGAVAEAASKIAGIGKVHVADAAHLDHGLAENVAPVAAKLMETHDAFFVPSTTTGRNLAPRVAALLDVMQVSDILSVEDESTFTRPIYAGNAIATVRSSDAKKVITVRGTAFERAARDGGSGTVEQVDAGSDGGTSSFVGLEASESERPELTSARIIVSGGRAFGSSEQFHARSIRSPTSSAPRSAPAAPRSMRVMPRTTTRSARPARSSLRKSTSPSAFLERFSTSPE